MLVTFKKAKPPDYSWRQTKLLVKIFLPVPHGQKVKHLQAVHTVVGILMQRWSRYVRRADHIVTLEATPRLISVLTPLAPTWHRIRHFCATEVGKYLTGVHSRVKASCPLISNNFVLACRPGVWKWFSDTIQAFRVTEFLPLSGMLFGCYLS